MRQLAFWVLIRGFLARNADTLAFPGVIIHRACTLECVMTPHRMERMMIKRFGNWGYPAYYVVCCIQEQLSASVQCQSYSFIMWLRWFSTATCGTPINNHPSSTTTTTWTRHMLNSTELTWNLTHRPWKYVAVYVSPSANLRRTFHSTCRWSCWCVNEQHMSQACRKQIMTEILRQRVRGLGRDRNME